MGPVVCGDTPVYHAQVPLYQEWSGNILILVTVGMSWVCLCVFCCVCLSSVSLYGFNGEDEVVTLSDRKP